MITIEIIVTCALLLNRQKKKRQKKYGVHPIVSQRLLRGAFYNLYEELKEHPRNFLVTFGCLRNHLIFLKIIVKRSFLNICNNYFTVKNILDRHCTTLLPSIDTQLNVASVRSPIGNHVLIVLSGLLCRSQSLDNF